MDTVTIGKQITALRKGQGMTQEDVAKQVGVSSQAVSKWENDVSCPDIMLLPEISKLFGVTVDALLGCEPQMPVQLVPKEERKKIDSLMLRIIVNSSDGDKVRINLPMTLIKTGIELGFNMSQVSGSSALDGIDLNQIMSMVENGLIGKLVEVESNDGDNVEIVVEEV